VQAQHFIDFPDRILHQDQLAALFRKASSLPLPENDQQVAKVREIEHAFKTAYTTELRPLVKKETVLGLLASPNEMDIDDWLARCSSLRSKFNVLGGLWDKVRVVEVWLRIAKKCLETMACETFTYETLKAL
jgi:hypothetical protein